MAKTAKKAAKKATRKKATRKKAAKKSAAPAAKAKKRRGRPTDVDLIKNLEARIKEVKERMAKKTQKDLTHVKSATKALKAITAAMNASKKAGDNLLRHALADGYRAIAKHYKANGYATPKANLPRGRRPKM
jgi:methyl coenzyme M reductase beta subunit